MSMIKSIIFDFDGVLVESMDIKARAFAYLFRDYPEQVKKIVDFHMQHGGLSRFEKFEIIYRDFLNRPLTKEEKDGLGKEFADFVYVEVVKCPYVEGAKEFLEKYYNRYLLFVVSGTPQEEMRSIVRERGLEKYFVEVFGTPEKKRELNLKILQKYKFNAEEVMFIGDSIDDWNGVQDTGIKFVGRVLASDPFPDLDRKCKIRNLFELEGIINAKI